GMRETLAIRATLATLPPPGGERRHRGNSGDTEKRPHLSLRDLQLLKKNRAGREAVNMVRPPDRAQLARGEEPGQGQRADPFLDRPRVVVRRAEHPRPAAVATEEQRPGRRDPLGLGRVEQLL